MALTDKSQLRKDFLAKRNALDETGRSRSSAMIRQRLFANPAWKSASTILSYVSFGSEVDTHTIIQETLRYKKHVVIPIHDERAHGTPLSEITRFGELTRSHRGILQVGPEFERPIDPSRIELALVPGISFDARGARLGFGGGYFDQLLARMPQALRVALSFEAQISPDPLPLEKHDILMHMIITEASIRTLTPHP